MIRIAPTSRQGNNKTALVFHSDALGNRFIAPHKDLTYSSTSFVTDFLRHTDNLQLEVDGVSMVTLRKCLANRATIAAFLLVAIGTGAGHAQCVPFSERIPLAEREMFSTEPTSLLQAVRNDNDKLETRVTGYLATDPTLLPAVRKLVADAPSANRRAIGAGLRRAVLLCTAIQPQSARKIIDFVRDLGDKTVLAGYVSVSEELDSPSTGPQITRPAAPPVKATTSSRLFSGEFNTELADPFASMPLPQ
ncbi:hypothetical protein [Bradyrhizobium prioriisuperbiae]|uniref:hypothetical protein n=1 Tax=Bradyrhizobium prioriisuperbiae TaxID=2854389 RepID=UPI0028EFA19A|nr:hypothetical protein [Bradyrhizobium prioritasuperba]